LYGVVVVASVAALVGECPSTAQDIRDGLLRGMRAFERAAAIDLALSCDCMLHAAWCMRFTRLQGIIISTGSVADATVRSQQPSLSTRLPPLFTPD
jgi:hypothetical protein